MLPEARVNKESSIEFPEIFLTKPCSGSHWMPDASQRIPQQTSCLLGGFFTIEDPPWKHQPWILFQASHPNALLWSDPAPGHSGSPEGVFITNTSAVQTPGPAPWGPQGNPEDPPLHSCQQPPFHFTAQTGTRHPPTNLFQLGGPALGGGGC